MRKRLPFMICLLLLSVGCNMNHRYQDSFRSLERPAEVPEGAVPMTTETFVDKTETKESLQNGQRLYGNYCVACHGAQGDGHGLVSQRGMVAPENFMSEKILRLDRAAIVDIILNGKERMVPMRRKISETEAYQIASFVKALQLSRRIDVKRLDRSDRERLP